MAGFTPASSMGWAPKDPVTSKQLNHLDQQLVKAINGVDGGAYDGKLQLSDVELMTNGAGGIHGAGAIAIAGPIAGGKYQPESVSVHSIDTASVTTCTLNFTLHDTFMVELADTSAQENTAVLSTLVFNTATNNADRQVKTGARFAITFTAKSGQWGGSQLGANAWPATVRFRSATDRLLDGTDDKDLTTYELVNRGTPQAPVFDVVGVFRGTRT